MILFFICKITAVYYLYSKCKDIYCNPKLRLNLAKRGEYYWTLPETENLECL